MNPSEFESILNGGNAELAATLCQEGMIMLNEKFLLTRPEFDIVDRRVKELKKKFSI
jgi:hypothetical protein